MEVLKNGVPSQILLLRLKGLEQKCSLLREGSEQVIDDPRDRDRV